MKEAKEVLEIYKSKISLFKKTGNDKFLHQMEVLKDILEIDDRTEENILLAKDDVSKKQVSTLQKVPVVVHYSFDCETNVIMCQTYEQAQKKLRELYEEEYRIQTEENGHKDGCDLKALISDDCEYASIAIDAFYGTGDEPDVVEWSIGTVI